MHKPFLVFIFCIGLTACGGEKLTKEQLVFNSWATVCDSYATLNIALAPGVADGSLSDEAVDVIYEARELIGPHCSEGAPMPWAVGEKPSRYVQGLLLKLQGLDV